MELVVRGGDQACVVGFGHAAALALAPGMHADPVEEPLRAPGLKQVIPAAGTPGAFPGHHGDGGAAAAGLGGGLRRAQRLARLILEAQVRPGRRR